MRKVVTYYAFDNTKFDSEEECVAYENEHNAKFKRVIENVILFDKNDLPASFENEQEFISIYSDCSFFIIRDDLEDDDTTFIGSCGYVDIPHKKGFYHNENYEWTELHESWGPLVPYIMGEKSV